MLPVSRWAKATAQLVQDQIGAHATSKSAPSNMGEYVVQLPALQSSWPFCQNPLQQVAELCEPLCTGLYEDVDQITQLLAELETQYDWCESEEEEEEDDELSDEDFTDLLEWDVNPDTAPNSSGLPVPSIIVTPCPLQPSSEREVCRVPLQDSGFGQHLTVPLHPTSNKFHPPQRIIPSSDPHAVLFDCDWRYVNGHWEAVVPSLSNQRTRGLYSRPVQQRRKRGASSSSDSIFVPRRFSRPVC